MSKRYNAVRLPIASWKAESFRFTAFPIQPIRLENINWWAVLINEPPEISTSRIKEGLIREEGPYESNWLVNQIQANRIDWFLASPPNREPSEFGFPTIGGFTEILEPFTELISRWLNLQTIPSIQRLAFGAVLRFPIENKGLGYNQLSAYLPSVTLDPEGSSDFLYQINRPRKSNTGIDDLTLNRLSKWSLSLIRRLGFTLTGTQPIQPDTEKGYYSLRLELDMNTQKSLQATISQKDLPLVFKELIALAKEIAENGDVP